MEHELRKVGTREQAIMTIRRGGWLAASVLAAMLWTSAAQAGVVVQIDKSSQRMSVSVDGATRYNWPVSTGRNGYGTPSGTYHPQAMMRSYFSKKYYNAPMPHAIFFHYGFAIHGTNDISRLGGPASHGCVRLHPANAATLFSLVQRSGAQNTTIEISN
jgi:lipoprotein-anchoring transpeptidase ErfK/SrfK